MTPIEKLNHIIVNCPDVKRSQISCFIPDWFDDAVMQNLLSYEERFRTYYYDDICNTILDRINFEYDDNSESCDESEYHKIEFYEQTINEMFESSLNNIWGFIYDW